MKKLMSVAALLSSFGTIFCCFLPAVFVTLGAGAVFAGVVSVFPQIVWLSEHKVIVFGVGAAFITLSGLLQRRAKASVCPIDPKLAEGCSTAKEWSRWILVASVVVYVTGFSFAFILPALMS